MMSRTELTLALAAVFLAAVVLGWFLRWGFGKVNRISLTGGNVSNDLAARLHAAEEAQAEAIRERDRTAGEYQNRLRETEAELAAAMDGLGAARREAEALRAQLSGRD